jgi:hypothetical protein
MRLTPKPETLLGVNFAKNGSLRFYALQELESPQTYADLSVSLQVYSPSASSIKNAIHSVTVARLIEPRAMVVDRPLYAAALSHAQKEGLTPPSTGRLVEIGAMQVFLFLTPSGQALLKDRQLTTVRCKPSSGTRTRSCPPTSLRSSHD